MTLVGYNLWCGRSHGADPFSPSADVHLSMTRVTRPLPSPCGRHKWMAL